MADTNVFPHESWWDEPKNNAHESLNALMEFLDTNQPHHRVNATRHARLYGNVDSGLTPYTYSRSESNNAVNRVTLNVIKSCCDSLAARISSNKPRALFLTNGGDWSAGRRAKLLQKYVDGVFAQTDAYSVGQQCFLDATVFGTGIMALYTRGEKLAVERVFPAEIVVDDAEGMYGKPANMYRRKFLPRSKVLQMFKGQKNKQAILDAAGVDAVSSGQNIADLIAVVEAYHLASTEGADDGRYVVTIDNATLVDEPYTHDWFPFIVMRLNHKLLGFWGFGIAEQLVGIQLEINKLLKQITAQMNLLSAPKVMVEAGSKIVSSHLTNEIGTILSYIGKKPDLWVPETVAGETFSHLERLVRYAYEITGVSQSNATSQKPAGLESGRALREYNDIESARFIVVGQAFERFYMELAQKIVWMTRELAANQPRRKGYPVRLQTRKALKQIDWADVQLDEDEYVLQIFPTSALPNTPAGRLQTVQELMEAKLIPEEEGLRLLDFPDLESANSLLTAALDDIDMVIEEMLDEGIYSPPEPMQNLELGLKRFQSAYLRARIDKAPEENLELLRRWMVDARDMLDTAQQQATAPDQVQVSTSPESTEPGAPPPLAPPGTPPPQLQ